MKTKRIIFNYLPPSINYIPSPAFSILKSFLAQHGCETGIIGWNIILDKVFRDHFPGLADKAQQIDSLFVGPFLWELAEQHGDPEALKRILNEYQYGYPQVTINLKTPGSKLLELLRNDILRVIDRHLETIDMDNVLLFGFSTKFYQWIPGIVLAERVKRQYPHIKIVIGGVGNKDEGKAIMSTTPHIDFTIWGEGEYPLLGLVQQLEKEGAGDFEEVPRLIYRGGDPGEFKVTTAKSRYLNLADEVYPDFSDFIKDLPHIPSSTKVYLTLETSRGCHWNRCKFCSLNDGYRYRHRSPESIAAEMEHMFRTHKINHYHLMGTDNVGKNLEDFERLLDILIESSLKNRVVYHIHSEIIPHNLDARIIEKMAIAGFIQLQIGYEAVSDSILSKMDKKSDVADLILFLKFAKKFGIATLGANIITGIIDETPDDVRQSTENLPFFRFFLNSGGGRWVFTHRLGKMRLDPRSRFKKMVPPEEQKKWNHHTIAYLLPRDLMEEEMQSHVFGFSRGLENAPQWDAFAAVNMFYEETGFSYKIMAAGGVYYYDEYMGDKLINHIAFNEPEYAAVLKASNDTVTSLEALFEVLQETFPAVTRERIAHIVEKLQSTYILYANDELTRIVSVIDIK